MLNMRRTKTAEDRVRDLHSLLLQKTQVREYKRDREAVRGRGREGRREGRREKEREILQAILCELISLFSSI